MIHRSQAAADNGSGVSRRRLLSVATIGVAGLAGGLSACAGGAGSDPDATRGGDATAPPVSAGDELASISEIPVGGGVILKEPGPAPRPLPVVLVMIDGDRIVRAG